MAKPLNNETEIYKKLKKEKIKIHPLIWKLINHYIGNDIYSIQLIAGSYLVADKPDPISVSDGKKLLKHCDSLREFLKKLKEITGE